MVTACGLATWVAINIVANVTRALHRVWPVYCSPATVTACEAMSGLHWGGGEGVICPPLPPRIWQIHLYCYNSDDFTPPTFLISPIRPPWSKILDVALYVQCRNSVVYTCVLSKKHVELNNTSHACLSHSVVVVPSTGSHSVPYTERWWLCDGRIQWKDREGSLNLHWETLVA